jgi:hypothetical protein
MTNFLREVPLNRKESWKLPCEWTEEHPRGSSGTAQSSAGCTSVRWKAGGSAPVSGKPRAAHGAQAVWLIAPVRYQ